MKDISRFNIVKEFKKLFSGLEIKIEESETGLINLTNSSGKCINITCEQETYDIEMGSTKYYDDYLIVGDTFIVCILYGYNNSFQNIEEIILANGLRGTIKRSKENIALLLTSIKYIFKNQQFDFDGLTEIQIEDLIDDNIIILEINSIPNLLDEKGEPNEELIDRLIYSVLVNVSSKEDILLEYRKYSYAKDSSLLEELNESKRLSVDVMSIKNLECMQYFMSAESIQAPHFKYLEYYHIIEYCFLKTSIDKTKKLIKNAIAVEFANGKMDDNEYYELFEQMFKHYLGKDDNAEEFQLQGVLCNDLGSDAIMKIFMGIELDFKFLGQSLFSDSSIVVNNLKDIYDFGNKKFKDNISDKDKDIFANEICRRIYKIRNYCVHTKKSENQKILTPIKSNLSILENDIIIIRALALGIMKMFD
ncbi:hypothetical protein CCS79_03025 [Clostridium diolis]|uniref:hypothetical protein n=1 Tax=Clostridium diolis TaxID=223919 RepID=UPI000B3FACD0|nr:hypothetical protein [Clostridium diolis]OVE69998.1 hypothetical protein CCS79_03025 [Clostridium diolis]